MRIFALVLSVLLSVPAWAGNTGDWTTLSGIARNRLGKGECVKYQWTNDFANTVESRLLFIGGLDVDMTFEPDDNAATITAKAKLYACATSDADSCHEFKWDTDGDGVVDNSEFDHASDMKKGLAGVRVSGWIYLDPTGDPTTNNAVMTVCSQEF